MNTTSALTSNPTANMRISQSTGRLPAGKEHLDFSLRTGDHIQPLRLEFNPGTSVRLADLVPIAHQLNSIITSAMLSGDGPADDVACRKGCAHCCYYMVSISPAEAFYIKNSIEKMKFTARRRLTRRSLESARKIMNWQPQGLHDPEQLSEWYTCLNLPCHMLEYNACGIYNHRPLVCREHLVTGRSAACDPANPDEPAVVNMPFSIAELLMKTCADLENREPEAVLFPLWLPWCTTNPNRETQTWPTETASKAIIHQIKTALPAHAAAK